MSVQGERENALFFVLVPWCSGLAYVPVKDEIAGSNPVGTARLNKFNALTVGVPEDRGARSHRSTCWTTGALMSGAFSKNARFGF